jgi:hypothetical protein
MWDSPGWCANWILHQSLKCSYNSPEIWKQLRSKDYQGDLVLQGYWLEENGYGRVSICKVLLEKCAYKVECKIR